MSEETPVEEQPNQLVRFFQQYPIDYLKFKGRWFAEQLELFRGRPKGTVELSRDDQKFEDMIHFDLHFFKFQAIESLFSLIFALEDEHPDMFWFNLSFPRHQAKILYSRISSHFQHYFGVKHFLGTQIQSEGTIPFWQYLFYFKQDSSNFEDPETTSENLTTLLYRLASQFNDRDDYNAFKHGFNVALSKNMGWWFRKEGNPNAPWIPGAHARFGFNYLQEGDEKKRVMKKLKSFSPEEDLYYLDMTIHLLENLIYSRRMALCHEEDHILHYFNPISEPPVLQDTLIGMSEVYLDLDRLIDYGTYNITEEKFEEAKWAFQQARKVVPKDYEVLHGLAYTLVKLEKYKETCQLLAKIEENSRIPHWLDLMGILIRCRLQLGDREIALKLIDRYHSVVKDDENRVTLYTTKALVLLELNDQYLQDTGWNDSKRLKKALKALEQSEANEDPFRPEIWFRLGFAYDSLRKFDLARRIFCKILDRIPDARGAILRAAEMSFHLEDLEQAESFLNKALEIDRDYSNTWNILTGVRRKQGRLGEAMEAAKQAYELAEGPNKIHPLLNMSLLKRETSPLEARNHLQEAMELAGTQQHGRNILVHYLFKEGEDEEVVQFTQDTIMIDQTFEELKIRAYALCRLGRETEAIELLAGMQESYKREIHQADILDTMGDVLRKMGKIKEAVVKYQSSLAVHPKGFPFSKETRKKLQAMGSNP